MSERSWGRSRSKVWAARAQVEAVAAPRRLPSCDQSLVAFLCSPLGRFSGCREPRRSITSSSARDAERCCLTVPRCTGVIVPPPLPPRVLRPAPRDRTRDEGQLEVALPVGAGATRYSRPISGPTIQVVHPTRFVESVLPLPEQFPCASVAMAKVLATSRRRALMRSPPALDGPPTMIGAFLAESALPAVARTRYNCFQGLRSQGSP
jgi:hypothetical protein